MIIKQRRIRLPQDVENWLRLEAPLNERSQNAQIVFVIREAMRRNEKAPGHVAKQSPDASQQ